MNVAYQSERNDVKEREGTTRSDPGHGDNYDEYDIPGAACDALPMHSHIGESKPAARLTVVDGVAPLSCFTGTVLHGILGTAAASYQRTRRRVLQGADYTRRARALFVTG